MSEKLPECFSKNKVSEICNDRNSGHYGRLCPGEKMVCYKDSLEDLYIREE